LLRISSAVLIVSSWANVALSSPSLIALPRENRSHSSELKVQRQHLVRKAANRLDQINYNFSLLTVDRHGNFPIANRAHSRGARPYRTLSNMNASDG